MFIVISFCRDGKDKMRYLARRYGEFFGYQIPQVMDIGDIPVRKLEIENRNKAFHEAGNIVVINRVNKLNARSFVGDIIGIRSKFPDKLLYLPFFGLPYDYPVLFYLGIDILDTSPIELLGEGKCATEFGLIKGEGCAARNHSEKNRMMDVINLSLQNGRFREIVESYSFSPFSKEVLRITDMEYYSFMERYMDIRPKEIMASSIEGLHRPEIVNFRKRVASLDQTADNLLLIPCSAVKPYSRSKTHRILHSFIGRNLPGIQEVIVTSPLGLVPRELESFFPARYYDIPVTGYWFNEEKDVLAGMAEEYFRNKKYRNVFYVLNGNETSVLDVFGEKNGITGNLNYQNSEKIAEIIGREGIKGDGRRKERAEFRNQLKFIYDIDLDLETLSVRKEGNRRILLYNGTPILKSTSSGIQMLKGLGVMLMKMGKRVIEIDGIFNGDTIFIPGIKGVSGDVIPGMEVVLVYGEEAVGRGISELSNLDLAAEKKGKGVSDTTYFH